MKVWCSVNPKMQVYRRSYRTEDYFNIMMYLSSSYGHCDQMGSKCAPWSSNGTPEKRFFKTRAAHRACPVFVIWAWLLAEEMLSKYAGYAGGFLRL